MRRSIHTKPELSGEAQCCGGFIPGGIGCWKERRSIHTKPELSGEAQCCGGFIPGGIGCWKEKTPAR
uniref:hypothetical protein n=1 Tax=Escherichia coli TaxID=562 RepID=UPI0039881E41